MFVKIMQPYPGGFNMTPAVGFVHPSTRSLRVLLADDNRDSTDSLAEFLRLVGCEVQTCYDGGAVLAVADEFCPDVCILDIRMPVLSGLEVARQLRRRAGAGGQPLLLIALTGVGGADAEKASRAAGFDHHILKPSQPQELLAHFAPFTQRSEYLALAVA